ncbi:MAG TPA: Rho termination factor N-terminal domain-containing protein [Gaiellaceae bacterium]|nr:Rho termination factor N-terminal domain-containing protein [Gaiellaceae bacterium]
MFRRGKASAAEKAAGASALAVQLAQDRKFRKRVLSALEHGANALQRARSASEVASLARDQKLLRELAGARRDLARAYDRVEKTRSHKLRKVLLLTLLALVAAAPPVRRRVLAAIGRRSGSPEAATPRGLEELTKDELYARAQEADIPGRSEMSKEELIEALRANS